MPVNIKDFPVMMSKCSTCPFNTNEKGEHQDLKLVAKLQQRVLNTASQICHHPTLKDKPETHLCRGARDFQLQIFHRIGFLDEATDEAWENAK